MTKWLERAVLIKWLITLKDDKKYLKKKRRKIKASFNLNNDKKK